MRHDLISDVLSTINNGDRIGKKEVLVPRSKLAKEVLLLMQKYGYIGEFEEVVNNRGGCLKVKLLGKINKCNSIRPRHYVNISEFEKFERRFLVAKNIGFLIVSTSKGIMTQNDAKERNIGGVLIGYVY